MTTKPRFPFGIPTGWFQVAYSAELAVGQVLPVRYFARPEITILTLV